MSLCFLDFCNQGKARSFTESRPSLAIFSLLEDSNKQGKVFFFPFWRIVKTHRRSQLSTINLLCLPSISITRSLPSHVHIFYPRRQTCGTPPTIFHRFDHSILSLPYKYINPKKPPPSSFPIHYLPQRKFLFPSKR